MAEKPISFTRPSLTGDEIRYIAEALQSGQLAGNGTFGQRCAALLRELTGANLALVTGSGTHALEMAFLVLGLEPGDEVIMPSFTFASTANAVALRGGVPVFVDIREDTLNLDEEKIEAAITPRTRALLPVHYAGVACAMDRMQAIAERHRLDIVEDAAHAIGATWQGRPLGGLGRMGAFSFHQTKNLSAGEAGALLINDPAWIDRAEIVWEKGTTRLRFGRGEIGRYEWTELGSSYLASELVAAMLLAQIEAMASITARRQNVWQRYHASFEPLEQAGRLRRPVVPADCGHNAHIYYLLAEDAADRDRIIRFLGERGIRAVFHYVPLHESKAGRRYGRAPAPLPVTERQAARLLRLPIYPDLDIEDTDRIVAAVAAALD
ncbi:MAG: dTDP-4-amino-4,6-dideoxygalactose transaminase [Rhodospirillaceae bacterium]|nr:dTDP-4-amino-4,6-dideoxygalactose transaminase [Rhodospirillaceae bacterium]